MAINEVALFDILEKLDKKLDVALNSIIQRPHGDLKELNAALAEAQREFKIARPTKVNNYWKSQYECLGDLVRASRDALAKNGLSVRFEEGIGVEGATLLTCILAHSSGQSASSTIRVIPAKNDPKSIVSEIEYLKRMLYAGMTGVVAEYDDDDAVMAMVENQDKEDRGIELTVQQEPRQFSRISISPEQIDELNYELSKIPGPGDYAEKFLKQYNIKYISDLPKDLYREAITRVREIRDIRTKGK